MKFTDEQIKICDDFEALAKAVQANGVVKTLSLSVNCNGFVSSYAHGAFGTCIGGFGKTVAANLQDSITRLEDQNPSSEANKLLRINALKAQLEELEKADG